MVTITIQEKICETDIIVVSDNTIEAIIAFSKIRTELFPKWITGIEKVKGEKNVTIIR